LFLIQINHLGVLFYNIFLLLFKAGTRIAALFNPKAAKWVRGRKGIFKKLELAVSDNRNIVWMHCSSLGEFEQGRPVLEKLRDNYPGYKFLLTFFSPSGYEVRKDYKGADWVFYLPMDGQRNAKRFLEIVNPSLVIFVKYEFWYYYLKKIKYRKIPLLLISALFRKDMSFFRWYGSLGKKMLSRFDHLFVQNESSKQLLDDAGLGSLCSVSGDTRFDRVAEIAKTATAIEGIETFIGKSGSIVAGSTWKNDEELLHQALNKLSMPSVKLIIAPHEVTEKHIKELLVLFPSSVLYSGLLSHDRSAIPNVLIIDNIGMLSRLYRYGDISYVGGGFTKSGIHNVLEAAVYGKVVLFGPNHEKFSEAAGLKEAGGALSFNAINHNASELRDLIEHLFSDKDERQKRGRAAGNFVESQRGATQRVMKYIQEKRLLTS
jgi:3-deoxy-D-manno-octulosonic-acid transferase